MESVIEIDAMFSQKVLKVNKTAGYTAVFSCAGRWK